MKALLDRIKYLERAIQARDSMVSQAAPFIWAEDQNTTDAFKFEKAYDQLRHDLPCDFQPAPSSTSMPKGQRQNEAFLDSTDLLTLRATVWALSQIIASRINCRSCAAKHFCLPSEQESHSACADAIAAWAASGAKHE